MWFRKHKALLTVAVIAAAALIASYFAAPAPQDPPAAAPAAAAFAEAPQTPVPKPEKEPKKAPEAPTQPDETEQPASQPDAAAAESPACILSISYKTILNNMDALDPGKQDLISPDGILLAPTSVSFESGQSVFDVLKKVCHEQKIHMEFSETPLYNSVYIEGIGNLYEFDCGALSGWMYSVNGVFPNYGCSNYLVQNGDVIAWQYTCDLGADIGGGEVVQDGT